MARVDDYREAFRIASEKLKTVNLHRAAKLAGASIELLDSGALELSFPYLYVPHRIRVKDEVIVEKEADDREVSLPHKVLLCHYLLTASGGAPSGELITFLQVPDGHFYYQAFQKRARDPFLKVFGNAPDLFRSCGLALGGKLIEHGDVGMQFQVLPRIAIRLILWLGDDEFPPEASVLFDDNIAGYLPAEDIAFVSGTLVYTLMGLARNME